MSLILSSKRGNNHFFYSLYFCLVLQITLQGVYNTYMKINNFENSNPKRENEDEKKEEGKNKESIFTEESDKALFIKVIDLFGNSTLNSRNLGEYTNSKMPTVKVIKEIKELGLIPRLEKLKRLIKFNSFHSSEIDDRALDYEKLARILLKIYKESN